MTNVTVAWLMTSLFCLGILFIPVGLAFILVPNKVLLWGNSLNIWISTKGLFGIFDTFRNHDRLYYKHHRLLGSAITLLAGISIYVLGFYSGVTATTAGLEMLAVTTFGKWLLVTCYYILIVLCGLGLIAGIVIFIRPSLLKSLESWGNRWIDTQSPLQRFDDIHDIPTNVLPGKPRLFGCFVLLGAIYIAYFTGARIF